MVVTLYHFDGSNGLFKESSIAEMRHGYPLIPEDCCTDFKGKRFAVPSIPETSIAKPMDWRLKNKVCRVVCDDPLAKLYHWEEVYDLRGIVFYELDKNNRWTHKVIEGTIQREKLNFPIVRPSDFLKIPKWYKKKHVWIEGDKHGSFIDNEGFYIDKGRESELIAGQYFVDAVPDKDIVKPQYKKGSKAFVEGITIGELRAIKKEEVRERQRGLFRRMDDKVMQHRREKDMIHLQLLDKLSITKDKYKELLLEMKGISEQGKSLRNNIDTTRDIFALSEFDCRIKIG